MHSAFETNFVKDLLAHERSTHSKRFAVYRNNVFVSLVEALKARFPAIRNAVGGEFFDAMARDYAGSYVPTSPLMMEYGDNFPNFIDDFAPLADYPWMGDLARLEKAITESYHAANAFPLAPEAFAQITPEQLADLRFDLHPAIFIVPSTHPVVTLWHMNTGKIDPAAIDDGTAETAIIHRPEWMVDVKAISTAGGVFLSSLWHGITLGEAASSAIALDPYFNLTYHLHLLIAEGLITRLSFGKINRNVA